MILAIKMTFRKTLRMTLRMTFRMAFKTGDIKGVSKEDSEGVFKRFYIKGGLRERREASMRLNGDLKWEFEDDY